MTKKANIKQLLFNHCKRALSRRLNTVQNAISSIEDALLSETKSSAGDKHETGRAILQLEREKAGKQLLEIQKQFEILNRIHVDSVHKSVRLGSVVFTSKFNYFISISAGEFKIDNTIFYAISPVTPLGHILMAKTKGDDIAFRSETIVINKVL